MKKLLSITAILFGTLLALAQAPEKMSYQAIVRNASGQLLQNQNVAVKASILQGSATGTVVYSERLTGTTNANGLLSAEIGTGTVLSGTFSSINWSSGNYWLKTETDPAGGTNYTIAGTSQLLSVPYAMYAKSSGSGASLTLPYVGTSSADNVIPFRITNSGGTLNQAGYFENTSASNSAPALMGINYSTGSFGTGVEGRAQSNTNGNGSAGLKGYLLGTGNSGAGVYGYAQNADGVSGSTTDGIGVVGSASGSGTGGYFRSTSTGYSLETLGPLKLGNINAGSGKVLTSDASGNATWQDVVTPKVHFSSVGGSSQAIPQNTATNINSWTNNDEAGGFNYNSTTGEYTIPVTGYYSVTAQVSWSDANTVNAVSPANVAIVVNGISVKTGFSNSSVSGVYYSDASVKLEKTFTAGDKIKIKVYQAGRATNSLYGEGTNFAIHLIHK
ncbi:MAG: hypothetical protein QM564_10625 [Bergeyella sp.]